jgi:very-short-patch-repair endonuclease
MVIKKREYIRAKQRYLRDFARENRKELTEAERLLWTQLRNHKLGGFKFRREHPIGEYIVDFICMEARVIVELDGGVHAGQEEYDAMRDSFLKTDGYRVLRFQNSEMTSKLRKTVKFIAFSYHCMFTTTLAIPALRALLWRTTKENRCTSLTARPSLPNKRLTKWKAYSESSRSVREKTQLALSIAFTGTKNCLTAFFSMRSGRASHLIMPISHCLSRERS